MNYITTRQFIDSSDQGLGAYLDDDGNQDVSLIFSLLAIAPPPKLEAQKPISRTTYSTSRLGQ